ncbi:tetratricopeptide repeat-containing sensor histidine kinase [Dokdonia donghaensis]|uniref:Signal transduction histidine kinase internal region domain-containing protein n=1 Tax=Dokdonia donghaensis DSW-1 TaxID=1300343 RepID=A0A0A2GTS2_9FLAO|nr:tetratricopeptide repeat protein [Dokdonia donghaensis]ANH59283.1 Sensor histidine kinase YpdA [Dokdonia donghaensis DSW-1]KGO06689.1 hypothetical protein NV36_07420 [Dokdonia donghaensis DSW-1]
MTTGSNQILSKKILKVKYTFVLLFIVVTALTKKTAYSQSVNIDSITVHLDTIYQREIRLKELLSKATSYRDNHPKLSKALSLYGVNQSKHFNLQKEEVLFTKELGIYHRRKNQLDSALIYYNKAIKITVDTSDSLNYYRLKGSIGNVLKAQGNYKEAIKNFMTVIANAEKNNNPEDIVVSSVNIAAVYLAMQNPEKAKDFYLKALRTKSKVSKQAAPKILSNLVVVYLNLKKIDSALYYSEKAKKIITSKRSLANLNNNRGIIFKDLKKYNQAAEAYKKALSYYELLKSTSGITKSYNNLAQIAILQKDLPKAENYLKKGEKLIQTSKDLSTRNYFYETQIDYYNANKDYKNVLLATKKLNAIKDSILGIDKQKAIKDIEIKYETAKIKQEKKTAEQSATLARLESTKNKNLFIGSLIIVGLVLLAALLSYSRIKTQKKAELITLELRETQKRLALEKQYRDSELKALKAQMNPHFIFNALNSIQEYIILNEKNLAGDYLGKFADLMRRYLQYSDAGHINLQQEIESLKMYLDLEALRFGEDFKYQVQLDETLNPELIKIPTMLIQPYVENAIKHGLLHKEINKKLHISFTQNTNKTISCTITDNGIGREASSKIKSKVKNLQPSFSSQANANRLNLLNEREDVQVGVQIRDLKDTQGISTGTQVVIVIPILKN